MSIAYINSYILHQINNNIDNPLGVISNGLLRTTKLRIQEIYTIERNQTCIVPAHGLC